MSFSGITISVRGVAKAYTIRKAAQQPTTLSEEIANRLRQQFDAIVDFAGVEKFIDTPVKRYSSGMYVRLAFAVAAHLRSEILIVDEVLAVGDAEFQKKCLDKMRNVSTDGRTVLFVSHNMHSIATLCGAALVLNHGHMIYF